MDETPLPAGFIPTKSDRDPYAIDPVEKNRHPYLEFENLCIECDKSGCAEITIVIKPEFMDKTEGLYGYNVCGVKAGKGCRIVRMDEDEEEGEEDSARNSLSKAFDTLGESDD